MQIGTDFGTLDPQALYRRRMIADALRASSVASVPTSFGGGIGAIGQALFGAIADRRLDPHEKRARQAARAELMAAFGMGGGAPMAQPGMASGASSMPAPPIPGTSGAPFQIDPAQTAGAHTQAAPMTMPPQPMPGQLQGGPFTIQPGAQVPQLADLAPPVLTPSMPGIPPVATTSLVSGAPVAPQAVSPFGMTPPQAPGTLAGNRPPMPMQSPPVQPLTPQLGDAMDPGAGMRASSLQPSAPPSVRTAIGGGSMSSSSSSSSTPSTPAGFGIDPSATAGASAPQARPASGGGLPGSLVNSESGGNWNALNSEGYGGRGQFGTARLADAYRAGVIPRPMTGAEYSRAPREVQLAVENWHKSDILGDLGQYVGRDVDGAGPIPPLTEDSLLAVAHLGGTGGARRFIESGGRYDPADSNGTNLSDYAMTHAGGGSRSSASSPSGSSAPSGGGMGGGGVNPELLMALMEMSDNPYAPAGADAIVSALIGQQLGNLDPMRAMEMERAQLELAQMRNPPAETADPTSAMQNYDFLVQQGVPAEQAIEQAFGGGGVTVNTGDMGADIGTIPQGYSAIPDPNEPSGYRMVPIAGGPEDTSASAAAQTEQQAAKAEVVLQQVQGVRELLDGGILPRAGVVGAALDGVTPGATDLGNRLETIKSAVALDTLQAMREASPTGGALGAVSDTEMGLLQAALGSLSQNSSPELLRESLATIERVMAKFAAYDGGVAPPQTPGATDYSTMDEAAFLQSLGIAP